MADENNPQQDETAKPAVKKVTKKKASTRKRTAPKKAATKRSAQKKKAITKTAPAPVAEETPTPPKPEATETRTTDDAVVTVTLEKPKQSEPQPTQTATPIRHVWWRAALMVVVVAVLFIAIRNAAHNEPTVAGKSVAPAPWATEEPNVEMAQPHPWELAPEPQFGNSNNQPPYYAPQAQQVSPRLEPWQTPQSDPTLQTQPYYPPPPGPYGSVSATDNTTPYQR
jgi:hypothetical protein